jgi:RNA polymerase sigma-70 factor, ECF subfamily
MTGDEREAPSWEDVVVTTELLARARAGDTDAFAGLVAPYRRELHVHCYRILGSTQDAEDALQETLVAAWQGLGAFQAKASLRTWLYRIATNQCLNAVRSASRRPRAYTPRPDLELPEATPVNEPLWLEPYPDVLLDELPDRAPGPDARHEMREAISLAFVTALQVLPPRQRAVLILRDVLGYRASEVAEMLESSEESVTSALKRARATLEQRLGGPAVEAPPAPAPAAAAEPGVIDRLTRAFEANDVDAIVALLTDDVRLTMPPLPFEYRGLAAAARFLVAATHDPPRPRRLVHTRANHQPAFGMYVRAPGDPLFRAVGLIVVTLAGDRIAGLTRFETTVLPGFGLPRSLPA